MQPFTPSPAMTTHSPLLSEQVAASRIDLVLAITAALAITASVALIVRNGLHSTAIVSLALAPGRLH